MGKVFITKHYCAKIVYAIGESIKDDIKNNVQNIPFYCSIFDGNIDETLKERQIINNK